MLIGHWPISSRILQAVRTAETQLDSDTKTFSHSGTNHRNLPLPLGALVVPHQGGLTQLAGRQNGTAPLTLLVQPQSTGAITSTSCKTTKRWGQGHTLAGQSCRICSELFDRIRQGGDERQSKRHTESHELNINTQICVRFSSSSTLHNHYQILQSEYNTKIKLNVIKHTTSWKTTVKQQSQS